MERQLERGRQKPRRNRAERREQHLRRAPVPDSAAHWAVGKGWAFREVVPAVPVGMTAKPDPRLVLLNGSYAEYIKDFCRLLRKRQITQYQTGKRLC